MTSLTSITLNESVTAPSKVSGTSSTAAVALVGDDFWNMELSDLLDLNSMPDGGPEPDPFRARSDCEKINDGTTDCETTVRRARVLRGEDASPCMARVHSPPKVIKPSESDPLPSQSLLSPSTTAKAKRKQERRFPASPRGIRHGTRSISPMRFPILLRRNTGSPAKTPTNRNFKRAVSFDKVQVREFEQTLEHYPCKGPALALGWTYEEKKPTEVDKFEAKRKGGYYNVIMGNYKPSKCSSLSPKARTERALKLGFSVAEIESNCRKNQKLLVQLRSAVDRVKTNDELYLNPSALMKAIAVLKKFDR